MKRSKSAVFDGTPTMSATISQEEGQMFDAAAKNPAHMKDKRAIVTPHRLTETQGA